MVKLQYNATKQLTQNGNYPHTNHTEEHFIPECKLSINHSLYNKWNSDVITYYVDTLNSGPGSNYSIMPIGIQVKFYRQMNFIS